MSCVTAVEGEWLAELGPMFFSIKESYESRIAQRHFESREKLIMEQEMVDAEARKSAADIFDKPVLVPKRAVATPGLFTKPGTVPKRSRIGL